MTKQFSNYSDLLTFTRASKGHALRPVSYGTELVTNGGFDTDSDWTKSANSTISGGKATVSITSGAFEVIEQPITYKVGAIYRVTATVNGTSGNVIRFQDDTSNSGGLRTPNSRVTLDGNDQQISFIWVTNGNSNVLAVARDTNTGTYSFTVDNVSVKEILFDQSDGTLTLFEHPNNVPRVEYDADGNRLGLLVEESRTNLVTYSEDFSNSAWTKFPAATVTPSSVTTPDGQQNGFLLEATGTNRLEETPSTTITGTATFSIFAKYDDVPYVQMTILDSSANGQRQWFKIQDGTLGSSAAVGTGKNLDGASITDMNNGFYRLSLSVDGFSGQTARCLIYLARTDSSFDAASEDSAVVYGAQLEAGSFPTSYIKTTGATATRSADVASLPVSDFGWNTETGTTVVEAEITHEVTTNQRFILGTNSGDARWAYKNGGTGSISIYDGTTVTSSVNTLSDGQLSKIGTFADRANMGITVDGETVVSSATTGNMTSLPTELRIGYSPFGANQLNGHIKSIKYYPRALTAAQLQEITT